jgi:hypothetical protein
MIHCRSPGIEPRSAGVRAITIQSDEN